MDSDLGANVLHSFGQCDEFEEKNTDCGCSLFLLAERWSGSSAEWKPESGFCDMLALISVDLQEVTNRAVGCANVSDQPVFQSFLAVTESQSALNPT